MNLLRVNETDDGLVVYFAEAKILDEGTILQVGKELLDVLGRATQKKKLMLDFERVQFMSSAMIGKLVFLNKRAKAEAVGVDGRAGLMGRAERVILYCIGVMTAQIGPMLWAMAVLTWLTVVQRFVSTWRQLEA